MLNRNKKIFDTRWIWRIFFNDLFYSVYNESFETIARDDYVDLLE